MRSGYRWFIIIIITTTLFDVGGREVGCSTVYEVYMAWYIVGIGYDTSLVYGMVVYGMVHR